MTTYYDREHLEAFKRAISAIAGQDDPPRRRLRELGRELAEQAGRARAWTGGHIYALLNRDRLTHPQKYGVNALLLDAALKRAGMAALNGTAQVSVVGKRVRAGSVVLARSRRCARRRCGVHFVGRIPAQRYCSRECEQRIAAYRRKRRRKGKG